MNARMLRFFGTIVWIGLLLAGCRGENGDDGKFHVRFLYDATVVTGMTLTGIGVPITNGLPDSSTPYTLDRLHGPITWTVNAPTTNYVVTVSFNVNEGEKGKDGILPPNEILTDVSAHNGADGAAQNITFLVVGNTLYTLLNRGSTAGTLLP